jgi:hypothetical protein
MRTIRLAMALSLLLVVVSCMEKPLTVPPNVPVDPNAPPIDPAVLRQKDAIASIQRRGGTVELFGAPEKAPEPPRVTTTVPGSPKSGTPGTTPTTTAGTVVPVSSTSIEYSGTLRLVSKVDLHGFHNVGAALVTLEPLRKLHTMNIYNTRPTFADLQLIATLTELRIVNVNDCGLTDAALDQFRDLKNLSELDLDQNPITNAGLARLSGLTNLRTLTLVDTHVTDEGIGYLRGMKNLENLSLSGKGITDHTLEQLAGLTTLRILYLNRCQITKAGMDRLKVALPRLEIIGKAPG